MDDQNLGLKTPGFWTKNIVQAITLGVAAYSIYSGHVVSPDEKAALIKSSLYVVGGVEAVFQFVHKKG